MESNKLLPLMIKNEEKRSEIHSKLKHEKKLEKRKKLKECDAAEKRAIELGEEPPARQVPRMIENTREVDETVCKPGDEELFAEIDADEFSAVLMGERVPKFCSPLVVSIPLFLSSASPFPSVCSFGHTSRHHRRRLVANLVSCPTPTVQLHKLKPRNTVIPTKKSQVFTNYLPGPANHCEHPGERSMTKDCRSLEKLDFSGIAHAPRYLLLEMQT